MKRLIAGLLLAWSPVFGQSWNTDIDDAFKEANSSGKNVLLFFSVSDACDICRRLDQEVFQSDEFREYAKDNLVLAKLDFRNQAGSDKAEQLLIVEKYNKDGFFPWVVLVNKHQKIVGKLPLYEGQPARQYVELIKRATP